MVRRTAVRVLVIALGTLFVGFIGILVGFIGSWIGAWSISITVVVVVRSALVMALLLALTRAFRIRDRGAADPAGRPSQLVLIAAGLAFAVNLAAWGGHVLLGELLVPAGVLSALIDFVMWMAVAILGVLLGDRARGHVKAGPVPYA
jgi:hypothetical protein